MANTTVSILIRFKEGGKRRTVAAAYAGKARLKPGIGRDKQRREFPCPGGVYWLRWYVGKNQEWQRVGTDAHDALVAQMRQERILAGESVPVEQSSASSRVTLTESIEEFVRERKDMNPDSAERWEKELALFQRIASSKTYLDELGRSDVLAYREWYREHGRSDNTIALRTSSLFTFGKRFGVLYDRFTAEERNKLTERSEGPVDYYTETDPEELKKFFAACDAEERLRFMFFLHTGAREKEVQYAMFRNLDLVHRTFRIEGKEYKGKKRKTKNRRSRTVPIPQVLADALTTWKAICGERQLIFTNTEGGPEGHFLYQLKQIALRAGLNCGHCVTGKYDEFLQLIPGTELSCKDSPVCEHWTLHKFRRTWATLHLWNGVPITTLQTWIGHSDLTTLNRYVAHIQAKSEMAKQMTENVHKMTMVQGSIFAEAVAESVAALVETTA